MNAAMIGVKKRIAEWPLHATQQADFILDKTRDSDALDVCTQSVDVRLRHNTSNWSSSSG